MGKAVYISVLQWFLTDQEGFSSTPYWDVSRYSWGYGTQAPGPTGTITREQAWQEALKVIEADYRYLSPKVTVDLSGNQWAALLDFAYNLGPANAANLIPLINSGDMAALESKWKQYVYSGGTVNSGLVARRNAEWDLFTG